MPPWQSAPLRVLLAVVGTVSTFRPRRVEMFAGPKLGRLLLALDPKRWKVADENLRRCMPELSEAERWELIKANYRHYGVLAMELMHFFSPFPGHYRRYCSRIAKLHGYRNWERAAAKGNGVLFATAHMGNWEFIAAAGGLAGMPLTVVTRRLKPEWLLRKVERSRLETGVRAVYQPRTLPVVMKALRRGESVGFVMDQYAPPPMGIKARFFGIEVDTLAAVGSLSQRTGAPVLPVSSHRDKKGIAHVTIEPELKLDGLTQKASTQLIADKVESWIRERPEQWLWVHRRFKNVDW